MTPNFSQSAAFLWSVADLLRGDFKQSQYGRIILPFTLLRRLECVLKKDKAAVLAKHAEVCKMELPEEASEKMLLRVTEAKFFNVSPMDLSKLGEAGIKDNLETYIQSFSSDAREIFEYFKFTEFIGQLSDANLLYKVVQKFANADLSPEQICNHDMGLVFEELIRRFAESSNETAGEHFTPRDIVRLVTALVFMEDDDTLSQDGIIRTIYDPTAGTGGFLSCSMDYVHDLNPNAVMHAFGQELNSESYAICKADLLIKGQDLSHIQLGNTLSHDKLYAGKFDYMFCNPPFGMSWKKVEKEIKEEHALQGYDGRFGPGLPRVSDASLLFLLHLVDKLKDVSNGGGRIGIILSASALTSGGAGSGESEIRRYLLENDLIEAVIALPGSVFFNTTIPSFILILSNKKSSYQKGSVKLIDARNSFSRMRSRIGLKSHEIGDEEFEEIIQSYKFGSSSELSKIITTADCGYREVKVKISANKYEYEKVPLAGDVSTYIDSQLEGAYPSFEIDLDHIDPVDKRIGKVSYRINFDELLQGAELESGNKFRHYFSEVKSSDNYDFFIRRNSLNVIFDKSVERKPGYWYFRIKDNGKVDCDYLRHYFKSAKGKEWISRYSRDGTMIRSLNKFDLVRSVIAIPDIASQRHIVSLLEDVEDIEDGLEDYVRDLWDKKEVTYVGEKLKLPMSLELHNQSTNISPFPLANLVHHYKSIEDDRFKDRYELLLKYFECLAIYLSSSLIGHLITVSSEEKVYAYLKSQKGPLRNASFGVWGKILKEAVKKSASEGAGSDDRFIQLITSPKIVDILGKANDIRNSTTGHGSYPTKAAARKTLNKVEGIFDECLEVVYELFDGYELVRPISSVWDGAEYTYSVQAFSGLGCYPFAHEQLKIDVPLRDGDLYLVSKQRSEVVHLFPFVRIMDIGGDSGLDAFYFYSGVEKKNDLNGSEPKQDPEFLYISHQQINIQTQLYNDSRLASIF